MMYAKYRYKFKYKEVNMENTNKLKFSIDEPTPRPLTVIDIKIDSIQTKNGSESYKLQFRAQDDSTKAEFTISDAWVLDKGNPKVQGMWLNFTNKGQEDEELKIPHWSTVAKVMNYYKIKNIEDFKGTTINAYPDNNSFLVILAYDLK